MLIIMKHIQKKQFYACPTRWSTVEYVKILYSSQSGLQEEAGARHAKKTCKGSFQDRKEELMDICPKLSEGSRQHSMN